MPDGWDGSRDAASINMSDADVGTSHSQKPVAMGEAAEGKSNTLFYLLAVVLGTLAGLAHITIEDPLITALIVLASTMFLGVMRPTGPWRRTGLVGMMVPVGMIPAHIIRRYARVPRPGSYGPVLLILPGIAGADGGFFA